MSAPTIIGRIAGAIAVWRFLSAELVAMGEPAAGLREGIAELRARYRNALVRHAAPVDLAERAAWEAS